MKEDSAILGTLSPSALIMSGTSAISVLLTNDRCEDCWWSTLINWAFRGNLWISQICKGGEQGEEGTDGYPGCPMCKGDLKLTIVEEDQKEVLTGSLFCASATRPIPSWTPSPTPAAGPQGQDQSVLIQEVGHATAWRFHTWTLVRATPLPLMTALSSP